jgi:hypothetical protein
MDSSEVIAMPKKEHLPNVSDKEQKMYEHVKASERSSGKSLERSKAIAAATVVKHHNQSKHKSGR